MAINHFRSFMPYGIDIYPDNSIRVFNRDYQTIEFNPRVGLCKIKLKAEIPFEELAVIAEGGRVEHMAGYLRLWFYTDATTPFTKKSSASRGAKYMERIRKLSLLEVIKDGI
jgi:hypothetical protein